MIPVLIGLAVVIGLALLVLLYWSMLDTIFPEKLSTNEVFLVTTQDLWKIRMCRYRKGRTGGQPVLLVHGANSNQFNFTCPAGISLVDYLVERGYDCWTVDLRGTRSSIAPFERHAGQVTTDDYLNDDIPTAIRLIQQETGYARIHYIGHSMGGMLLYAYALKFGTEALASGVTLGSPLGFEGMAVPRTSFLFKLSGINPKLSGSFIRGFIPFISCFRISTGLFPTNMRNIAKTMNSAHFYSMIEDPLPGVLKDFSRWISHPGWRMDNGNLNVLDGLSSLDLPLFALYAPLDPFVSLSKAKEFFDALPTADKRMLVCSKEKGFKQDYNHCDLAFSQDGAREVFGPIARWLETHPIKERMPFVEPDVASGYQSPLGDKERAAILSGGSYAHLSKSDLETADDLDVDSPAITLVKPTAKKKPAARKKKPATRKATAPKKTTGLKKPTIARKVERATPAPETSSRTTAPYRKAPSRGSEGGPNLASASAAMSALGSTPRNSGDNNSASKNIVITPRSTPKSKARADGTIETPKSVLKALSDASGVLDGLKKPKNQESDSQESE